MTTLLTTLPLPQSQLAVIEEDACIGCTKCIQACPVDAIIGAAKYMHTVISDECIGCGLCLPPCPVDCIELMVIAPPSPDALQHKLSHAQQRFTARNTRLAKLQRPARNVPQPHNRPTVTLADVQAAVRRALAKKTKVIQ